MKQVKFLGLAALTLALGMLAGCGEKKIDGSSEESFRKSAQAMMESLPDDKKGGFSSAVGQAMALGIKDKGKTLAQSLDGKNAAEVTAYVEAGVDEFLHGNRKPIQFRP